jgi:hypothetical protein
MSNITTSLNIKLKNLKEKRKKKGTEKKGKIK